MELTRNRGSGELMGRYTGADAADWWPTAMALSSDDKRLYVVGNWPSAVLIAFIEPSGNGIRNQRMLPRERMPPHGYPPPDQPYDAACSIGGLRQPRGIALSPDDRHLYATSIADDSLVVLRPEFWRISDLPKAVWDGSVRQVQLFQDDQVREPAADAETMTPKPLDGAVRVDGLHTPRGVVVSRDGRDVYVAGSGEDALTTFRRDAETGRLQFVTVVKEPASSPGHGLESPLHLAVSPADRHLYVACAGDTVMVFGRSAETGRLKWLQTVWNGRGGIQCLEYPRQVAVSPRGNLVFVAASGRRPGQAALSTFVRDAKTGKLTLSHTLKDEDHPECGLEGLSSVRVSPDGRHVYTTSLKFSVAAFAVRPQ